MNEEKTYWIAELVDPERGWVIWKEDIDALAYWEDEED